MDEMVLFESIKGEPKTGLMECLLYYKKDRLIAIAEEHKLAVNSKSTKNRIADELEPLILKNFKKDLEYLQQHQIDFLFKVKGTFPAEMDALKYGDYKTLVSLGYVYLFNFNEHIYPVIPNELSTMLSEAFAKELKLKSVHNQKLLSYAIALVNLYGVYEIEQFVNVWNTHNKEKITILEANEFIDVMGKRQGYFWQDDNFIVSNYFENDEYCNLVKEMSNRPYYTPKKSDIEFYSKNEYDDQSIYYKKVERFIKSKNFLDENRLEDILWDISEVCFMDKRPSEIIDILNENDFSFEGIDEVNVFMKLIMDLSNNSRKWVLRGYKPSELFERYEKPLLKPLPKEPFEIKQKVGRNDSCTCGSGLKYKKCCGKRYCDD